MGVIDALALIFIVGITCIMGGMYFDYKSEEKKLDSKLADLRRCTKCIDFSVGNDDDEPGDVDRTLPEYGRIHIISNSRGLDCSYPVDITTFEKVRMPDGRTRYSCYSFPDDSEDDYED